MPVELWGDTDGSLYRSSYFEMFPGRLAPGRLDQVLGARQLRRHGPLGRHAQPRRRPPRHERVLQRRRGAAGDHGQPRRPPRGRRGRRGRAASCSSCSPTASSSTTSCATRIGRGLRSQLSPRHVPDTIRAVPAIPRTLTGKKLETPVKRILRGDPVEAVASRESLLDPTALDVFVAIAAEPTAMAEASASRSQDAVAIDVHAHVEMSQAEATRFPTSCATPPCATSAASRRGRRHVELAQLLPRAADDGRRVHGRLGVVHRTDARAERGDRRGGAGELRRPDPVREHRPAQGAARRRRGAAPDRRARRARLQVPPQRAGLLPERPPGLPALRGDRGGRAAGALPHRALGRRLGPPGRRRHPPQVLEPDARRRRRRRLPDAQDRARAPVVPVAGRGDLDRAAQAAGLHRPVRMVAEVLPAAARPPREHAAARARPVRQRLPVHHARSLARGLRRRSISGRRCGR